MNESASESMSQFESAVLGGGCFWCLEAVFERLQGVESLVSGYCGGRTASPTYEEVCSGHSGHAEVVRVVFDPRQIAYREILEVFFAIHDPTTLNRQGADVGTQYRSVIFYENEVQHGVAAATIAELDRCGAFAAPIVTQVLPAASFHAAERYHQGYFRGHERQPYCQAVIAPKLAKFRRRFASRLREA
jgi:peptide-methionine (S)-S-oxide reductase